MENAKILTFDENDNYVKKIAESIKVTFNFLKSKDLLITNRKANGNYLMAFADSLYNYEKGVIMVERFYKKDKCESINQNIRTMSDEDKKLLLDFKEFSENIPSASTLTKEITEDYVNKIADYKQKIKQMIPEISSLGIYKYDDMILAEIKDIDDSTIDILSNVYANFAITLLSTLTWSSIKGLTFAITTIEEDDYIDLIVLPMK